MRITNSLRLIAGALSLTILLGACGGGGVEAAGSEKVVTSLVDGGLDKASSKELADLYQKALDGNTTIYFYGVSATGLEKVFEQFQETFPGLKVVANQLGSPDTIARVTAEQASGKPTGSVVSGTSNVFAALEDSLETFDPETGGDLSDLGTDPSGFYANAATPYGPVFNTETGEAPTSWHDVLLTDKYDGQITSVDPLLISLTSTLLSYLLYGKVITEADLTEIARRDVKFYPDSSAAALAVGNGERQLMMTHTYSVFKGIKETGVPIDFAFPMEDGNVAQQLFVGMPKGVENTAAAELLMQYLFTPQAQTLASSSAGYLPTLKTVDSGDSDLPGVSEINDFIVGPPIDEVTELQEQYMGQIQAAFKK